MSLRLQSLRQNHPRFIYQRFSYQLTAEGLELLFFYTLEPELAFTSKYIYHHVTAEHLEQLNEEVLQNWIFQLGMVEGFSYWKAACSSEFVIQAGYLSADQLKFWEELLKKGLSEFFFVNQIDGWSEGFVKFKVEGAEKSSVIDETPHLEKVIIPVGGGKDSLVSIELLKNFSLPRLTLTINATDQVSQLLKMTGISENIQISRHLDPQLLELNTAGYLNGHTPFSAMAAFSSTLAAYILDIRYIAVSNEFSANEGNTTFLGQQINHQYSKSLEFESNFREYLKKYVSTAIEYFSFLRPMHEIQIAKVFCQYPQYFSFFLSCNRGQKTGKWCGECPKCLFVYIILSPFVEQQVLENIFGQNLLEKESLQPIFDELTGMTEIKSLECVGTRGETLIALDLTLQKNPGHLPHLLQYAKDHVLPAQLGNEAHSKNVTTTLQTTHFLPGAFFEVLRNAVTEEKSLLQKSLLEQFGQKQVLILGMGREGESTYGLLRRIFPDKQLGISDKDSSVSEKYGQDVRVKVEPYLQNLSSYDVIFKTPAISIHEPALQEFLSQNREVTSQLNEFLRVYRKSVVGVTGTKGKSTTAALIHQILVTAGRPAILAGNIGTPVFESDSQLKPETIPVIEMSSYQLESVMFSPHLAVFLNIFPEHLNYHGSFENYLQAKGNITRWQNSDDVLIYNAEVPELQPIWANSTAQKQAFSPANLVSAEPVASAIIQKYNLPPAALVAKHFKIDESIIQQALSTFKPLPHRLEQVGIFDTRVFVDDTLATIPEASCIALDTLERVDVILLGGYDRGLDFTKIVDKVIEKRVPTVIFFKPSGEKMFGIMKKNYSENELPTILFANTMEEAVNMSYQHCPASGTVLLSPASPSFGQFKDYEDKAAQFAYWAKKLAVTHRSRT